MRFTHAAALSVALAVAPMLSACDARDDHEAAVVVGYAPAAESDAPQEGAPEPDSGVRAVQAELGARLFRENRLSNPGSQYLAACNACHKPPDHPADPRAWADSEPRSLLPSTGDDMKNVALRNTPTLLDAALAPRFNWSGEYASLEEAVKSELLGRHMGWMPDQRRQAVNEVHALVLNDIGVGTSNDGTPYVQAFKEAYDVDLATATGEAVLDAVVLALADYVRLLKSPRTAPYDAFAYRNGFDTQLDPGERPADYAARILNHLAELEERGQLEFPEGFGETEYEGLKIFMRPSAGNCVACHPPPAFTDFQFHNMGVSQMAYDAAHGQGAFAEIELPAPGAARPVEHLALPPDPDDLSKADLGYWNYIETDDPRALSEAQAAFKTPPLRNLGLTDPYMHNGRYSTVEAAVRQKMEAARMVRDGALVNPEPALFDLRLSEADVAPLAAFLRSLDDAEMRPPTF